MHFFVVLVIPDKQSSGNRVGSREGGDKLGEEYAWYTQTARILSVCRPLVHFVYLSAALESGQTDVPSPGTASGPLSNAGAADSDAHACALAADVLFAAAQRKTATVKEGSKGAGNGGEGGTHTEELMVFGAEMMAEVGGAGDGRTPEERGEVRKFTGMQHLEIFHEARECGAVCAFLMGYLERRGRMCGVEDAGDTKENEMGVVLVGGVEERREERNVMRCGEGDADGWGNWVGQGREDVLGIGQRGNGGGVEIGGLSAEEEVLAGVGYVVVREAMRRCVCICVRACVCACVCMCVCVCV